MQLWVFVYSSRTPAHGGEIGAVLTIVVQLSSSEGRYLVWGVCVCVPGTTGPLWGLCCVVLWKAAGNSLACCRAALSGAHTISEENGKQYRGARRVIVKSNPIRK